MSSQTIVITGASRGIGFELVKQFSHNPANRVIAACRQPEEAKELQALNTTNANVIVVSLDTSEETNITTTSSDVGSQFKRVNLLINNASTMKDQDGPPTIINAETMMKTYKTNVVGPMLVTQAFLPLMKTEPATVVNISQSDSINDNANGVYAAYRCSKAALNQLTKNFALDEQCQHVKFLSLYPGHVKTDLGGENASISVEESVKGLISVIMKKGSGGSESADSNGRLYNWKGEELEY